MCTVANVLPKFVTKFIIILWRFGLAQLLQTRHWGLFIKDVRTEGGGGVGPKADIVREGAWILYCVFGQNVYKEGGGGSKIPKNLRKSFTNGPQTQRW